MSKAVRKIKPYTNAWERMANQVAHDFAPPIHACKTCGGPYAKGYICGRCGSREPYEEPSPCKN